MNRLLILCCSVMLIVSCSKPEAGFVANLASPDGPKDNISFTNKSVNCESYVWNFGDGQISTEENPTHKFTRFGNLQIVLEGKSGGSINRDTQYINIPEPPRKKVKIETDMGDMVVELFNTTPLHRDNFIKLAESNFYEGLLFHRVMDGFMIQGGDPVSRNATPEQRLGMGDPGYVIPAEYGELHYKGRLAAARKPTDSESNGSQFYLVEGKQYSSIELMNVASQYKLSYTEAQKKSYAEIGGTPFLDQQYTVFGQVIEGIEVIDKITQVAVRSDNRPLEDIKMKVSIYNEQ